MSGAIGVLAWRQELSGRVREFARGARAESTWASYEANGPAARRVPAAGRPGLDTVLTV